MFGIPVQMARANIRRPFQLKVGFEGDFNLEGPLGLNIESDDCARFMNRNKKRLANLERAIAIDDGGRFGPGNHRPRKWFGLQNSPVKIKLQVKIAQNFQWINPGLESAVISAQQGCASPNRGDECAMEFAARYFRQG